MESVPKQRVEEVTTMQAVRMLSSQNHRMQAKGYGLAAIAELLSDSGFVVTAKTLKTYLGEARAAGGRKNRRKGTDPSPMELRRQVRRQSQSAPWRPTPPREMHRRSSGGRQGDSRGDDPSSNCSARGDPEGDEATVVTTRAHGGRPSCQRRTPETSETPAFGKRQRR
jgi:hypothetical protein